MIEGISKLSLAAFEVLEGLELEEKLIMLAILFEHWDQELINDGNHIKPEEAYERNKAVFTPMDCGLTNAKDLSAAFKALVQVTESDESEPILESSFPDLIESQVNQTVQTKYALSAFYRLTFKNKLEYFAELMAKLEEGELLKRTLVPTEYFGINGYEAAAKIITYKETLFHESVKNTVEDLPFELA